VKVFSDGIPLPITSSVMPHLGRANTHNIAGFDGDAGCLDSLIKVIASDCVPRVDLI
jgi:hypothetical protein